MFRVLNRSYKKILWSSLEVSWDSLCYDHLICSPFFSFPHTGPPAAITTNQLSPCYLSAANRYWWVHSFPLPLQHLPDTYKPARIAYLLLFSSFYLHGWLLFSPPPSSFIFLPHFIYFHIVFTSQKSSFLGFFCIFFCLAEKTFLISLMFFTFV